MSSRAGTVLKVVVQDGREAALGTPSPAPSCPPASFDQELTGFQGLVVSEGGGGKSRLCDYKTLSLKVEGVLKDPQVRVSWEPLRTPGPEAPCNASWNLGGEGPGGRGPLLWGRPPGPWPGPGLASPMGAASSLVEGGQAVGSCEGPEFSQNPCRGRPRVSSFHFSKSCALGWGTVSSSCFLLLYKTPIKALAVRAL